MHAESTIATIIGWGGGGRGNEGRGCCLHLRSMCKAGATNSIVRRHSNFDPRTLRIAGGSVLAILSLLGTKT